MYPDTFGKPEIPKSRNQDYRNLDAENPESENPDSWNPDSGKSEIQIPENLKHLQYLPQSTYLFYSKTLIVGNVFGTVTYRSNRFSDFKYDFLSFIDPAASKWRPFFILSHFSSTEPVKNKNVVLLNIMFLL